MTFFSTPFYSAVAVFYHLAGGGSEWGEGASSRCIRVAVAPLVPHLVAPPIPRNINNDDTSGFLWFFVRFGIINVNDVHTLPPVSRDVHAKVYTEHFFD